MYIVTHTSPDWDAIGAVWLLQRFGGMEEADVRFVNTGAPDLTLLEGAAAVVDTGRVLDPERLRFDHHQLPGAEANGTCATFQVFGHLAPNGELVHLAPLNALILHGDTGGRNYGAEWSRLTGIHALLSVRKARRADDLALLTWGCAVLDDLADHLKARYEARETLEQHTVYRSADSLLIALSGAPQGATFAAFELGARLVVFHSETPESVAIGVMRGGEQQEPHCKALILGLLNDAECDAPGSIRWDSPEYIEMARWYLHEAGFFAGRGTAKAPDPRPLECSVADIARAIDAAWRR